MRAEIDELEFEIVEAAIGLAIGPEELGMARLRTLDHFVCKLLAIRAKAAGLSVDDYIERERQAIKAEFGALL